MNVSVVNKSAHPLPAYATEGSSGLDLRANIEKTILLAPLERILIPTGLFISIPQGAEAQIRPRSGLALKKGLTCLNTPGTIDADYRGELKVLLVNFSNEYQSIENGDRIAQLVFAPIIKIDWQETQFLEQDTARGDGGFGHTGQN